MGSQGRRRRRRRRRRCKQLLDDFKDTRGQWWLKEEALGHTLCRAHFGRNYGPVRLQNELMPQYHISKQKALHSWNHASHESHMTMIIFLTAKYTIMV